MNKKIRKLLSIFFSLFAILFGFSTSNIAKNKTNLSKYEKSIQTSDIDLVTLSKNGKLKMFHSSFEPGLIRPTFYSDKDDTYIRFGDFYFDYYLVINIPNFSFDKEGDYLGISLNFNSPSNYKFFLLTHTFRPNESNVDEKSNFILDRDGDTFYIRLVLEYARNTLKSEDQYDKNDYRLNFSEISLPKNLYPNYIGLSEKKEFSFCQNAKSRYMERNGFSWFGDNMFLIEIEKAKLRSDFSPISILNLLCAQREKEGELMRPANIICAYDRTFGNFFYDMGQISEGKYVDYKFYMRFYDDESKTYGSEKEITVRVKSIDTEAPSILVDDISYTSHSGIVQVSYDKSRSLEELEECLNERISIVDNSGESIKPSYTISNFVPLKIKDFKLVVSATDFSHNTSIARLTLQILDDIPPSIKYISKKIETTIYSKLTEEQILANFVAIDEIDKDNVKLYIGENEYFQDFNYKKQGTYTIEIKAMDSYGNESSLNFPIYVSIPDEEDWTYDNGILYVTTTTSLDALNIVNLLVREGQLEKDDYVEARVLAGDLINGNNVPGEYNMSIEAKNSLGVSSFIAIRISVKDISKDDKNGESSGIVIEADSNKDDTSANQEETNKSFWQKIADFFASLWEKIVNFFK